MLSFIPPFTELITNLDDYCRYYPCTNNTEHLLRLVDIERIEMYYDNDKASIYRDMFYQGCEDIFEKQPRLALYIPFEELRDAPDSFRKEYLRAWRECCRYLDVRESFNVGDIYEQSASEGEPERVVKAYHLLPWLIRWGYLSEQDLVELVDEHVMTNNYYALSSIKDTMPITRFCVSRACCDWLTKNLLRISTVDKPTLKYATPKRQEWLRQSRKRKIIELQHPAGPFSANMQIIKNAVRSEPNDGEIFLIGGSTLKGYSTDESDTDIYHLDMSTNEIIEASQITGRKVSLGDPALAHVYLNTVWCGKCDPKKLHEIRKKAVRSYLNQKDWESRRRIIERLEYDLLQFRLMHKGMRYAYPDDLSEETRLDCSIDGASAFYDDRYRQIATLLFVRYVWLP